MPLTVREVLQMPPLNKAEVLTEDKGLNRHIAAVTVMDAPDSVQWLKGKEFLITSGYIIKDSIASQEKLIRDLAAVNAAGLGIKLRRFIDEIPAHIVQLAKSLDFPIIVIPFETPWIDIISSIHFELLRRQSELILQSERIYKQFGLSLLHKGGYQAVCQVLCKLIRRPVLIVDSEGGIYGENWPAAPKKIGGAIADRLAGIDWDEGYLDYSGSTFECFHIEVSGQQLAVSVTPVVFNAKVEGFIAVCEGDHQLQGLDHIAIEQAAIMCALQTMINSNTKEVTRRFKNHFVEDLISGSYESLTSLQKRAEFFDWDLKDSYTVLVIDIDNFGEYHLAHLDKGEEYIQDKLEVLFQTINDLNKSTDDELITLEKSDSIVVLLPIDKSEDSRVAKEKIMRFAQKLRERINARLGDLTVSIGVGRLNWETGSLFASYEQAGRALKYGKMLNGPNSVCHYDDLGIYRILCECRDQEGLKEYFQETVARLADYDRKYNSELVKTLEAFFANDGSVRATADELFVHSNTVRYRMERVMEVTGLNPWSDNDKLSLQVGLKIAKLLNNHHL